MLFFKAPLKTSFALPLSRSLTACRQLPAALWKAQQQQQQQEEANSLLSLALLFLCGTSWQQQTLNCYSLRGLLSQRESCSLALRVRALSSLSLFALLNMAGSAAHAVRPLLHLAFAVFAAYTFCCASDWTNERRFVTLSLCSFVRSFARSFVRSFVRFNHQCWPAKSYAVGNNSVLLVHFFQRFSFACLLPSSSSSSASLLCRCRCWCCFFLCCSFASVLPCVVLFLLFFFLVLVVAVVVFWLWPAAY